MKKSVLKVIKDAAVKNFKYKKIDYIVGENITQEQYDALRSFVDNFGKIFFGTLEGPRRSGKTELGGITVLEFERLFPEGDILLASFEVSKIKSLFWDSIMDLSDEHGYGFKKDESGLDNIHTPIGNKIMFRSLKDKRVVEWARGEKFKLIIVDESQSVLNTILTSFIDEAVTPAQQDFGGFMLLSGTPSRLHFGRWYDWAKRLVLKSVTQITLTAEGNCFLNQETRKRLLDAVRETRGLVEGKEDAKFKREYKGEWVVDTNSLVFPYNKLLNDYDEIPEDGGFVNYVIAADLGYTDLDAFAVFVYSLYSEEVYLVEEFFDSEMTVSESGKKLQELYLKYGSPTTVVDLGGLGKKIGMEFIETYGIDVIPAEKTEKAGSLKIMQAHLKKGLLKLKSDSRAVEEMSLAVWDDDRKGFDDNEFHPDMLDTSLYAFRYIYNHIKLEKPEEPEEVVDEFKEKLRKERMEKHNQDDALSNQLGLM